MTSLNFPSTPSNGQIYEGYVYDSAKGVWKSLVQTPSLTSIDETIITSPTAGQKLIYDGTNWVNLTGYVFVQTLYYTSNGTFTKATYPWLRAIRVKCVGGGGGGGGAGTTTAGQTACGGGGGGGGYAESFITNISGLDSSITVTRGPGGAGGAAGANNGTSGSSSSFGSLVVAGGGGGGSGISGSSLSASDPGNSGTGTTGDILMNGERGGWGYNAGTLPFGGFGGASGGGFGQSTGDLASFAGAQGPAGQLYGGGGGGAANGASVATARAGGAGANGIVTVELYA